MSIRTRVTGILISLVTSLLMLTPHASAQYVTVTGSHVQDASGALLQHGSPTASQTVNQPSGTTLGINNLNNVIYAQAGQNLAALCASFSGANGTVNVTTPQTISKTTVLPANCTIKAMSGGVITVASGQYLQIAGPFHAGMYQVFSGPGAVYFSGGGTEKVIPQWFGAMGNNKAGAFTATVGNSTVTINGRQVFAAGDTVTLAGAGASSANLTTTVASQTGSSIVVATAPSTTVSTWASIYTGDDTAALQAWANSIRGNATNNPQTGYVMYASMGPSKLYVPKGQYVVGCTSSLRIYSSLILEFEAANTTHSSRFAQCNYNIPAVRLEPYTLDTSGNLLSTSGNMILRYVDIAGNFGFQNATTAPAISFDPGYIWSDTELDHLMCESVSGVCVHGGFATTTTASAGSSTITVGDGSSFYTGMQIVIAGAGTAGANLTTTIGGCGTTLCSNTFSISPSTSTTVASAAVSPLSETLGLKINSPELDVGYQFLNFSNNVSGSIWVDNGEIYDAVGGAAVSSAKALSLTWTNTKCFACGNPTGTAADGMGIYWDDSSHSKTADVLISHSQFWGIPGLSSGEAGAVEASYMRSLVIKNSQWWNVDSQTQFKGVLSIANKTVDVEGNIFQANTLATGAGVMIEFCCSGPDVASTAIVTGNTLQNTSTNAISQAISTDAVPVVSNFAGNVIAGNITSPGAAKSVCLADGTNCGIAFGTPSSSSATCSQGQTEFDAAYLYTCVAANTWRRVAMSSF